MLEEIIIKDGSKIDCGFYGIRYLFHALTLVGREELAYSLIMRDGYPSYKWFVEEGMTALAEGFKQEISFSRNHHFFGDISHWFIRTIAGINVNPNYNNADCVHICPHFISDLSYAKASYSLRNGNITVSWQKESDGSFKVNVVADSKLNVRFIAPNGYSISNLSGKKTVENPNGELLLSKSNI